MHTLHIALVPEAGGVELPELLRVSSALQKQVTRDLHPAWGVSGTVDAFASLDDVPVGHWPVLLTQDPSLGQRAGVHMDASGQPYALIHAGAHWSLAASQACLHMLVNPFGTRTVEAGPQRSGAGLAELLLEVCGPCGDARYAYLIDGVAVSDFCTPAFFEREPQAAGTLSHTRAVTQPLQPLAGGYLIWYERASDGYWLRSRWDEQVVETPLGAKHGFGLSLPEVMSVCSWVRSQREAPLLPALQGELHQARSAARDQARQLRALLAEDRFGKRLSALPALEAHASTPVDLDSPAQGATSPDYAWVDAVEVQELPGPQPALDAATSDSAPQPYLDNLPVSSRPPPLTLVAGRLPRETVPSIAPVTRNDWPRGQRPGVEEAWLGALGLVLVSVMGWVLVDGRGAPAPAAAAAPALATAPVGPVVLAQAVPPFEQLASPAPEPAPEPAPPPNPVDAVVVADARPPRGKTQRVRPERARPEAVVRAPEAPAPASAPVQPSEPPAPPIAASAASAPAPQAPPPIEAGAAAAAPAPPITASFDALIESRR